MFFFRIQKLYCSCYFVSLRSYIRPKLSYWADMLQKPWLHLLSNPQVFHKTKIVNLLIILEKDVFLLIMNKEIRSDICSNANSILYCHKWELEYCICSRLVNWTRMFLAEWKILTYHECNSIFKNESWRDDFSPFKISQPMR